ncbi:hypothetical protein F5883DRAFT_648660 [Diaporthe sp. PMI_573]|nr:hypothetical protein F5883DRAFT_648660 [Diaporthaceae sp. PMI_573]
MATKKSSTNAAKEGARKTRSQSSKDVNSHGNGQLSTPPPEAGTTDTHPAPKSDTKAPAKKAENTPGKPSDHEKPLTLTAISVDAQTPDSPTSQHAEEGEENDTDHNSEDDSDHSSDNEEDYEDLYSGETTDPADVTGLKREFHFTNVMIKLTNDDFSRESLVDTFQKIMVDYGIGQLRPLLQEAAAAIATKFYKWEEEKGRQYVLGMRHYSHEQTAPPPSAPSSQAVKVFTAFELLQVCGLCKSTAFEENVFAMFGLIEQAYLSVIMAPYHGARKPV